MADCPSLMQYDALYGHGSSEYWIDIQVSGIFGASNSKEKGVADGIRIFCQSFASQVKAYKLSELMLFFARYKAGKYDNSFASFDARRIGNAFFKEFRSERNYELDAINRKRIQNEIENRRFTPPEGYSSLSWYNELKRRAESGDAESKQIIDLWKKIRIKWSSKGMKRRKEICERFGFSSYLTLNHESEVYVRAEDLPVFNETVRRGFLTVLPSGKKA